MKAKKYIVRGRVQGVGYRYFTQFNAKRLRIKGYVKNLYNGDVEVYAIGDEETLNKFKKILMEGPPAAMVVNIEEFDMPLYKYNSFEVSF